MVASTGARDRVYKSGWYRRLSLLALARITRVTYTLK